jgi:hypothetical protein
MFAFGVCCLSAIIVVTLNNLKHNRAVADDFSDVMKEVVEGQQEHQREMRHLASEDSQALQKCLEDTNRIIGRSCNVLDWHERRQTEHEKMLDKVIKQQSEMGS